MPPPAAQHNLSLPLDGDGARENRKENLTPLESVFSKEWLIYTYTCTYTYTFNMAFLQNKKYKKGLLLHNKNRNKGVIFFVDLFLMLLSIMLLKFL
jgi:hypothetical protein